MPSVTKNISLPCLCIYVVLYSTIEIGNWGKMPLTTSQWAWSLFFRTPASSMAGTVFTLPHSCCYFLRVHSSCWVWTDMSPFLVMQEVDFDHKSGLGWFNVLTRFIATFAIFIFTVKDNHAVFAAGPKLKPDYLPPIVDVVPENTSPLRLRVLSVKSQLIRQFACVMFIKRESYYTVCGESDNEGYAEYRRMGCGC